MLKCTALLCWILLLPRFFIIAQQTSDKPASTTVESSAAPRGPVFDVGPGITPPRPVFTPDPDYPPSLRKGKHAIQGTCVLGLIVDEEGRPRDVHLIRSLGQASRPKCHRGGEAMEVQTCDEGWQIRSSAHVG